LFRDSVIPSAKQIGFATTIYALVSLLLTGVSLIISPVMSRVGTFRPVETIPGHLALIALLALLLGAAVVITERRLDLVLLLSIPTFAILTDLDHLPSIVGVAQPIRPAHSLVFAAMAAFLIVVSLRRLDMGFAALSGFSAHLVVDTGVIPPVSPLSFMYVNLSGLHLYFAVGAVTFAILSGLISKERGRHDAYGLQHR
jgi:hypothetical protein